MRKKIISDFVFFRSNAGSDGQGVFKIKIVFEIDAENLEDWELEELIEELNETCYDAGVLLVRRETN